MAKPIQKRKARLLRKNGLGVKTIAHKLGVSSSTVSLWCRDIELTKDQIKELEKRSHDPFYGLRLQNIERQKKKRLDKIEKLKNIGIKDVGNISSRENFLIGTALYWAEGFKKDKHLGFANTDPVMVKFFLNWLIKNCKVPKKSIRLRVGINISHKNRLENIQNYWSKLTNIPLNQFQKPYFQNFKWKKEFEKPEEYYGVLRIRANQQLELFRKINGWIEGLKQNTH